MCAKVKRGEGVSGSVNILIRLEVLGRWGGEGHWHAADLKHSTLELLEGALRPENRVLAIFGRDSGILS